MKRNRELLYMLIGVVACAILASIFFIGYGIECNKNAQLRVAYGNLLSDFEEISDQYICIVSENEDLYDEIELLQNIQTSLVDDNAEMYQKYLDALHDTTVDQAALKYIARTVVAEAGNQSYDGMCAVAQCIYDRWQDGSFGETVYDVIDAPNQFAQPYAGNLDAYRECLLATAEVFLYGKRIYADPVLFFYNPKTANPRSVAGFEAKYTYLGTIGDHVFRSW